MSKYGITKDYILIGTAVTFNQKCVDQLHAQWLISGKRGDMNMVRKNHKPGAGIRIPFNHDVSY
jgi:hypothetical protein